MIYRFIDDKGTFIVENPQGQGTYFPLTNRDGTLLSAISPSLSGDIKKDNEHFLTLPASIEDLRSNLLCRRDFFIKADNETIRLSYPYDDTLEAGFLYQKLVKNTKSLVIEVLNFIPYNLAVEVMCVKIRNQAKRPVKITPTFFMPLFGRAERNLRDHRHVSSLLNRIELDRYGILLKPTMIFDEKSHRQNRMTYFVLGFEENRIPPRGQFPTLDYFYGSGDIVNPDAIEKNIKPAVKKSPEFDGKEACAALRFRQRTLRSAEEINYFFIMGMEEDKRKIKDVFRKLGSPRKIEQGLQETKKYWQGYLSGLKIDFKDRDFNNWLLWVRLQPVLRKLFGCSFLPHFDYGKGGRGWRDLWQDVLALLMTEPDKSRAMILNNFKGVRIDGSNATIITKDGGFISDRNRINRVWSDHGVWPYLVLRSYIHKSGDLDILDKEVTYFRDHQLKRAREIDADFTQDGYLLRDKKGRVYKGTVLEHLLVENLVQFFNVGKHNAVRLENADWNDGLDMAAENGEGVAFSFMYAHNLRDIAELLVKLKERGKTITVFKEALMLLDRIKAPVNYKNYKEKQKRLNEYFEKTKDFSGEKIAVKIDDLIRDLNEKAGHLFVWLREREWIGSLGFFNGYYDNRARRAEGRFNRRIRMMLASQVFAIMSGAATTAQIKKTWLSLNKYLQDKKLGGFRLNTDFGCLYLDLGRAFGFAYGDKENGAFFNHMAVMLANALYGRGFAREGRQVMRSIYNMATGPKAKIYPMLPEYFNGKGQGLYQYLTGSASWYVHTLMEETLGIRFLWGDILFEPKLFASDFTSRDIEAEFTLDSKRIKVVFVKEKAKNTFDLRPMRVWQTFSMPDAGLGEGIRIKRRDIKSLKSKKIIIKIILR